MVSKLDETWRVVIISQNMYVVKFKGGYDKNQWYFMHEVVPFTSKHRCFYQKHPHYKCNILFWSVLNPKLFMCSPSSIHTNILKFQAVWTSFAKYCALIDIFLAKCPWNWKSIKMTSKWDGIWHAVIISRTWYVVKIWEDFDKNWWHLVYKLH